MARDKETGEWLTCEECGCEIRGRGTKYCATCRKSVKYDSYDYTPDYSSSSYGNYIFNSNDIENSKNDEKYISDSDIKIISGKLDLRKYKIIDNGTFDEISLNKLGYILREYNIDQKVKDYIIKRLYDVNYFYNFERNEIENILRSGYLSENFENLILTEQELKEEGEDKNNPYYRKILSRRLIENSEKMEEFENECERIEEENQGLEEEIIDLEDNIMQFEEEENSSLIKESFLVSNKKELNLYYKEYRKHIKILEDKRDKFYRTFFENCKKISVEYKQLKEKFKDEDKNIEAEINKKLDSKKHLLFNNIIGKHLRIIQLFNYKIYRRLKMRRDLHNEFIKSKKLNEIHILMLNRPLFYLMRAKYKLYISFIKDNQLSKKEKIVFDKYKFKKVKSLPKKIYPLLQNEFIDLHKSNFHNFVYIEIKKIEDKISTTKLEIKNIKDKIRNNNKFLKNINLKIENLTCPNCYSEKKKYNVYCFDCQNNIIQNRILQAKNKNQTRIGVSDYSR